LIANKNRILNRKEARQPIMEEEQAKVCSRLSEKQKDQTDLIPTQLNLSIRLRRCS
jgi:hypothetical protein